MYPRATSIELDEKMRQRERSADGPNPFIDPEGCQHYINFYEQRYLKQLEEEQAARG